MRTGFAVLGAILCISLLAAAPAFAALDCTSDQQGADDEPGQKDLNEFCDEAGTGSFELHATWNFDDLSWSGANTGDSCGLFDTDGDGNANFALCVTVEDGPPATQSSLSPRLYTCGDTRPDRCTSAVQDTTFSSTCVVNSPGQDSDPFSGVPGHTTNKCTGTGCATLDTFISCQIDVNDVLQSVPTCGGNHRCSNNANEYCDIDADCVPLTDVCSYPSSEPNSDPSDCVVTNPACANVDCSTLDDACNIGVCNPVDATCTTEPKLDGTACGDSTVTTCDGADTCVAGVCVDNLAASGTACGDSSDTVCDNPDTCDGSGSCQANNEPGTVVCRADAGDCDVPEYCDGAGSCPADSFESAGTACGSSSDTVCDNPDSCDASGQCQSNHEATTVVCRADAGDCDVPEYCNADGACPADSFESAGAACGSASDTVCDNPDSCDASGQCQSNHEATTVVCRADAGACDVPEYCNADGTCPANSFESAGTACGSSSDTVCDNPDTCNASGQCQSNHDANTVLCRASADVCDVPEYCDGNGNCPANGYADAGTGCEDGDACTIADVCDGDGNCQGQGGACTAVCRTPGFWGARGTSPTGKEGITDKVLDLVGGSVEVCGQTIDKTTPIGELDSALEAECVKVEGVRQRQLYRQLVATRLNCVLSYTDNCDDLVADYSACDDICSGAPAPAGLSVGKCIKELDCFNNGGEMIDGKCALGICSQDHKLCGAGYGKCAAICLQKDIYGNCTLAVPQTCEPFSGNCHDQDLCPADTDGNLATLEEPDLYCFEPIGRATSSKACNDASLNTCTIDNCP